MSLRKKKSGGDHKGKLGNTLRWIEIKQTKTYGIQPKQ